MALHLRIENETNLPDGGPINITVNGKRGIDIGRDSHLDWTLPDPTRYISSKHAEIRFREGAYWLHDVSTNGTLLNGSDHRMQAPHRLRDGDHFTIGHYIIAVAVDGEAADPRAAAPAAPPTDYQSLWDNLPDVAPPIDRQQLKTPRDRPAPVNPDFLDWAADVPVPDHIHAQRAPAPPPPRPAEGGMDWSAGEPRATPPSPPLPPELPAPRRPLRTVEAPAPWSPQPPEASAPFERPATPFDRAPRQGPAPEPVATAGAAVNMSDDFLQRFAQAAGVSPDLLSRKDSGQLADELGAMVRAMVENLMQLLNARHQARLLARSSRHTTIQAFDNNPLKFSPSVDEALRTMFSLPTRAYLSPVEAIRRGFGDIKQHEIKTYAAMQHALAAFVRELDPKTIEQDTQADSGISALVTSRKAKLWDAYVARWQAQIAGQNSTALDRFMLLFAEFYDRDNV